MAASSVVTGGVNELAARLPSALAALGTVLLVFTIGRRLFDPASGFWAAVMLATSFKVMWQARVGQIDMLLTFLVTLTAYCWVRAMLEKRPDLYLWGFGVAGLGTITKGPVALLPILLSFVAFFLWTGRREELRRMRPGRGLLLWAAVVLAWLLPAGLLGGDPGGQIGGPSYLHELIFTQNVTRYTAGADYGGTRGHIHPFYYYLTVLPAEFLPWSVFLPAAWLALRRRSGLDAAKSTLLASWAVTTLVFFSLSPAKRSVYVLQLYPALALVTGAGLVAFARSTQSRSESSRPWVVPAAVVGLTLGALAAALAIHGPSRPEAVLLPSWMPGALAATIGLMAVVAAASAVLLHRRRPLPAAATLGAGFGVATLVALAGLMPVLSPLKSVRPISETYLQLAGDEPYAVYPRVEPALYYYTGRFAKILHTDEELHDYLASPDRRWLFVEADELERRETPIPAVEVARGADPENGYVLLANRPPDPEAASAPSAITMAPQRPEAEVEAELRVQLEGVDKTVRLVQLVNGSLRFVLQPRDGDALLLTPDEFARRIHQDSAGRSWWQRVFNISSAAGFLWVACGFLGQALFTGRMLVQWLASERQKRSVVPVAFWWLSLVGATMLLAYFIWRRDIVGVLGQATGWFIYVRNLTLLYRERPEPEATPSRESSRPAIVPSLSEPQAGV